jgi:hypothetical protein
MKTALVAAAAFAAVAASSTAEAADGCGRGMYFNGYRCAPMQGGGGYRVYEQRPRYYGGPVYGGPAYADPGHPYGYNHNYGDPRCGRPNFTIQDGVCKPYTGR